MTKILLILLFALATAFPALAGGSRGGYRGGNNHHHHGGTRWVVGVNVGYPGWGWPYYGFSPWAYPYYPYRYYPAYYPAPVVVQQQPTTYVEQPAPQAPTGYWYYCADPGAYYPYIKECPAGWQRVAPQPGN